MKKTIITLTLILGMAAGAVAQPLGGGLFQRGETSDSHGDRSNGGPMLPTQHGFIDDQNADESPLGSGIAVLVALGGAYLVGRRRKAE